MFCALRQVAKEDLKLLRTYKGARIPKILAYGDIDLPSFSRLDSDSESDEEEDDDGTAIVVLESLEHEFYKEPDMQPIKFWGFIRSLCATLHVMQTRFAFEHGDLKSNNLMIGNPSKRFQHTSTDTTTSVFD